MKTLSLVAGAAVLLGAAGYWALTQPGRAETAGLSQVTPDLARGEQAFFAAGCASCHAAKDAEGPDRLKLGGGQAFPSDFGTFYAPNISPDRETGIGGWDLADFARALRNGVSPEGEHYYPAFPYTAYAGMTDADLVSLFAYLRELPQVSRESRPHDVAFPFSVRRNLGIWKAMFGNKSYTLQGDLDPELERGRYLVEVMGHCAECHTPRNLLGGLDRGRWMAGAPDPEGRGRIPGLTPATLDWSKEDIVYFLQAGFTPDYDTVGGSMASVVENLAQLPRSDVAAIAAYLKAIAPVAPEPAPASSEQPPEG